MRDLKTFAFKGPFFPYPSCGVHSSRLLNFFFQLAIMDRIHKDKVAWEVMIAFFGLFDEVREKEIDFWIEVGISSPSVSIFHSGADLLTCLRLQNYDEVSKSPHTEKVLQLQAEGHFPGSAKGTSAPLSEHLLSTLSALLRTQVLIMLPFLDAHPSQEQSDVQVGAQAQVETRSSPSLSKSTIAASSTNTIFMNLTFLSCLYASSSPPHRLCKPPLVDECPLRRDFSCGPGWVQWATLEFEAVSQSPPEFSPQTPFLPSSHQTFTLRPPTTMSKCIGAECTQTNAKLECPGCIKCVLSSPCCRLLPSAKFRVAGKADSLSSLVSDDFPSQPGHPRELLPRPGMLQQEL